MSILAVYDCMMFFMQAARPQRVRETFQLVEEGKVTYCLSPPVLAEIRDVLTRPKHRSQFAQLTDELVSAFLQEITRRSQFIENVPEEYILARDPKDSKYINLAIAAKAQYLVTRDADLLELMNRDLPVGQEFQQRFPRLKIAEPAVFVRDLDSGGS